MVVGRNPEAEGFGGVVCEREVGVEGGGIFMQLELTVGHAQQNPGTGEDVDIYECVGIAFVALDGNEGGGCFWEVECQEADDGGAGQEQEGPP